MYPLNKERCFNCTKVGHFTDATICKQYINHLSPLKIDSNLKQKFQIIWNVYSYIRSSVTRQKGKQL